MPDAHDLIDYEPCSYCGADIPADIIRCPKCGEFTDGAGPRGRSGQGRDWKKAAAIAVVVVALGAFLATSLGGC